MAEGVRKVNEWIIQEGRALIITDPSVNPTTVPSGSLLIEPTNGKFKIKMTGGTSWVDLVPSNLLMAKSITGAYVADRTITGNNIGLNAVLGENIKDLEITTPKIGSLAITEPKIANESITSIKLKDGIITESKIFNNAITTIKIKDSNITTPKIADKNVTTRKLEDLSVTEEKIAINAVSSSKILNLNVTTEKIADNAITNKKIANGSISVAKIDASLISLINDAANSPKIKDLSITTNKIADKAITAEKLETALNNLINSAVKVNASNNVATVSGSLAVNGNINATGDIRGARVFNAVYNDLAEAYIPIDSNLEPGDIVEVTRLGYVKKAETNSKAVVGVISDCFASLFGGSPEEINNGTKVAVGLIGKVPVKIAGYANIGDLIVSCGNGIGIATKNSVPGTIIGKVIENKYSDGIDKVLCLIFPA